MDTRLYGVLVRDFGHCFAFADNKAMATDPVRMANGTILVIPPNGANVIQAGQITPGTVPQPPATIHYGGSIFGNLSNQTQQDPQMSVFKKFNEVEAKTLGVSEFVFWTCSIL